MIKNYTAFQSVAKLVCVLLFAPILLLATGDHTKSTLANFYGAENTTIETSLSNESWEENTNYENDVHTNGAPTALDNLAPPCDIHVNAGPDQELCSDEPLQLSASVQNNNTCSTGCVYPIIEQRKCNSSNSSNNGFETVYIVSHNEDEPRFIASNQNFETFDDGTARFTATASNGHDTVQVDILYSGYTTNPPMGDPDDHRDDSPKDNNDPNNSCHYNQDFSTFGYYPNVEGTIISNRHGTYTVHADGPSFQIGDGGDVTRTGFGASGWFTLSGGNGYYEKGDINVALGDCQPQDNNAEVTYRWSTQDGNIIGNRNSQNIQVDQPGTYRVRVENCEGCRDSDTVVVTAFEVDAGDDVESCPEEEVTLTANPSSEPECSTCDESGSFSDGHQSVLYDLADCYSVGGNNSPNDYSEFTPAITNLDFATVNASIVYRNEGPHSCTTRSDPGRAACFGFGGADSNSFIDDAPRAVRFDYTLNADKGQAAKLDSFSFDEFAPEHYRQTSSQNNSVNEGRNNYPTRFGYRVLKNGQEIFREVDIPTSQSNWLNRFFDFANNDEFIVAEGESATFSFELYAYDQFDNNGDKSVWDLDTIRINASSCEGTSTSDIDYLWSNGETTQSIIVSPDETTTYSVTATSCSGCSVTDEVTVTIGEITADAGPDIEICEGQEAVLTASGGETYLWSTGETTAEITVTQAGEYTVEVTGDTGCTGTDSVIVTVNDPQAGTISPNPAAVCLTGEDVTITGNPAGDANVPDGYTLAFVLTSGDDLVIQDLSSAPEFNIAEGGKYTIHPFVFPSDFDPSTVVEFGSTTGFDVNSLLVQGGGDLCASLDVVGAMVIVSDPDAGTVTPVAGTVCLETGLVGISASPNGDATIPDGYTLAYVLTSGDDLVIQNLSTEPEFSVSADGKYTIHPFVYPSSFDPLSVVTPGVTTGGEVNALLVQGGGDLCASLDVAGAMVIVEDQVNIGNYVWNDENQDGCQDGEMGINGITVSLFQCTDGTNPTGNAIASMETQDDSNGLPGYYNFKVCRNSGEYIVVFDIPTGFEATESNNCSDDTTDSDIDDNGNSGCFEILDDDNLTVDAGIFDPVNVGDTVFFDNDRDGVQDPDEDGVAGVTVQLKDTAGNVIDETATDANGNYLFEAVAPGEYVIMFVPGTLPADYVFSPTDQGGDDAADSDADQDGNTQPFTVTAGQDDDLTFDAGINLPRASLGDTVFLDEDQDGIQDPGEEGVSGITVSLYICGETEAIATTTTDGNGNYEFADLEPNTEYYVGIDVPADFVTSPADQGGDDAADSDVDEDGVSDCVELSPGENDTTIDAGIYNPVNVGDTVFFDNDRDGVQDPDEDGVAGVTVQLKDTAGNVIEETATDANGNYLFEAVAPGEYVIMFVPGTLPADYVFSPADQGGDDAADSDADTDGNTQPFTVTAGQDDDLTFDAGINLPRASLGDTVFLDEDQDGIQDPGEEGVSGITVSLYICGETEAIATTTTDGNGNYEFADLEPNTEYYVGIDVPADFVTSPADQGGDDAADSDVDEDGVSDCVELSPGENDTTIDAGIFNPVNIGDTVFFDNDRDGVQDPDEDGVAGVTVQLKDTAGNVIDETVTDANGNYLFEAVAPGEYVIMFVPGTLPADYVFSPADQGGDDAADSDADQDGNTQPFTVTAGQDDDLTFDAGINIPCPTDFADAGDDVTICATGEVTLTATGGATYLWSTGATTASITVSPTSDTTYTVTVTTDDACEDTDEVVVIVLDPQAGTIIPNPAVCLEGDSVMISAVPDGNAVVPTGYTLAYVLTSGDDLVIQDLSNAPEFSVADAGKYTIHPFVFPSDFDPLSVVTPGETTGGQVNALLVQGGGDLCASLDVTGAMVNVNPLPEVSVEDAEICAGQTATLTAEGSDDVTYLWSNGETTASITVSDAGEYTVTVTSAEGCEASDSAVVTVTDPQAGTITPTPAVCLDGGAATILAIPDGNAQVPAGYTLAYVLTSGDDLVIQDLSSTPEFSVADAGMYTIHPFVFPSDFDPLSVVTPGETTGGQVNALLVQGGGDLCASLDVNGAMINVNPLPTADAGADIAICTGDSTILTASGGGTYLWSTGDTTASITVSPTVDTTYTVTVTSDDGCEDTDEVVVSINPIVIAVAGDDVAVCVGESATLTASGGESYLWSTGETSASIIVSPTEDTTYTVEVTSAEDCTDTDEVVVSINPEVVANAGADIAVCSGDDATLTASGGGTYLWSTGETSASIIVSPTEDTTYTVEVTSAEGCTDTDEVVVSINPEVVANAGADIAVCSGDDATLTASGGGTYLWSTGETSASIIVSPTEDTTYTVEVTSAEGCTDTDEVVVSINPEVVANAGADIAICSGDDATLTASGGESYLWSTGETSASIIVSPTEDTTYTVEVTSAEGCTDTDEVVVSINPEVVANAGADIAVCSGDDATLTASGGGTYLWSTGETSASIIVSPTEDTTYTVEVTSAEGCTDTDEVVVSINPEVVANAGADIAVCSGDDATLTASGGGTYLWSTGETSASIIVSPTEDTTYTVEVTSAEGCTDTDEVVVSINPEVVANAGSDVTSCSGELLTLTATGGVSYLWSNGETTAAIEVAPTAATTYTVTVTSAEGCTDTDDVFVNVENKVSVGDYVWNDVNENGIQDDGDTGVNGVTVTLYQCNDGSNSGGTMISSTVTANEPTTNAPGYYALDVCPNSGEYYVVFSTPGGFEFTESNVGDSALNSDADANGVTGCFTVGGTDITTIDAGLISLCDIDATVLGEEEICVGEEATILASGGDTYLWSNGETTASITVAPTETTTYTVVVTDSTIPDCSAELSFTVEVQSIAIDAGPDVTIESGESTLLTVSGAGDSDTILWSTGESTASITVAPIGTTTYSVTVVNDLGCIGEDSVTVNVNSACGINPAFKILPRDQPGTYTPGNSTAACLGDNLYLWMHMDPDNLFDGLAEDYSEWSFTFEFPNGDVIVQDSRPIWPGNQRVEKLDLQESDFGDINISWVSPDGCVGSTVFTLNFPDGSSCGPNGTRISDFYALGAVYPVPAQSGSTITLEVNTKTKSISTAKGASQSKNFVVPTSKTTIQVSLYNLSGRLVETPKSYDVETGMVKVYHELSNLPTGTYIIRVDGDEWFDSDNIIIE
ncbi:hypothetical protein FGM00_03945 [Aggregatimonas sangjinii]|uniref:PKD/Chitinase domain-containing protein n=1 Tax=Aggregatimonas sangjinii TaxID=2583587 RepID=A0A5B7SL73_9FLAO|nr:SdrD B-like domain-containing protein [Aggregatimonas sangjinii]QCW99304.1 hypothetical protein FGM00_03945 [Aggregatimonas sangjinii]